MAEEKDQISELKKLIPEARLKKLKEIEEKSKKEIEAAQKLIKESEEEITEKKRFEEKVPIPQLEAEGEGTLEAKEEKEMFGIQREKRAKREKEEVKPKQEVSLEDQLRQEHIEELARKPADELKEMMADIYKQAAKQDGYMTRDQREDFYSITKAEQNKIYAMKEGQYPKEQMGSALEHISASFSMGQRLRQMYSDKGEGNDNPDYQRGGF